MPCAAAANFRQLQPPAPATPGASAAAGASPSLPPASQAPPPPTATPRPAPQKDNVGFPEGYQNTFKLLFIFDRPDNKQVRVICGNDLAASIKPGQPFPYGSVMVMETYRTKQDASGTPIKDANGNFIREALAGIFVQRKEPGFGVDYGADRSGEWEYVGFRPDKSYSNPPAATNACASCHLNQAGASVDFAFRMDLFYNPGALLPPKPAENEVSINIYAFVPGNLTVKPGTTVTWINNDEAEHSINAVDKSFNSPVLKTKNVKPGEKFSYTFTTPGTYEYFCAIHPTMKAKIEVK
jgi:plastocyanin